ncbi:hypothetical protein BLNAU_10442 [Blattamonas nauphoetae]|uniref:Uncharacterized protein n=1 Tax=Blattamonas nauphoetae TaxID=2049346 RepID=A0ABQ9XQ76_9EUKA|nr:hypothetical protein BLNAU_10442 [Blattamonas nauphoetae]
MSHLLATGKEASRSPFSVDLPFEIYSTLKIPPKYDILPKQELNRLTSEQMNEIQIQVVKKCLAIKEKLERQFSKVENRLSSRGIFDAETNKIRARSRYSIQLKKSLDFEKILDEVLMEMQVIRQHKTVAKQNTEDDIRRTLSKIAKTNTDTVGSTLAMKTDQLSVYRKVVSKKGTNLTKFASFGTNAATVRANTEKRIHNRSSDWLMSFSEAPLEDDDEESEPAITTPIRPVVLPPINKSSIDAHPASSRSHGSIMHTRSHSTMSVMESAPSKPKKRGRLTFQPVLLNMEATRSTDMWRMSPEELKMRTGAQSALSRGKQFNRQKSQMVLISEMESRMMPIKTVVGPSKYNPLRRSMQDTASVRSRMKTMSISDTASRRSLRSSMTKKNSSFYNPEWGADDDSARTFRSNTSATLLSGGSLADEKPGPTIPRQEMMLRARRFMKKQYESGEMDEESDDGQDDANALHDLFGGDDLNNPALTRTPFEDTRFANHIERASQRMKRAQMEALVLRSSVGRGQDDDDERIAQLEMELGEDNAPDEKLPVIGAGMRGFRSSQSDAGSVLVTDEARAELELMKEKEEDRRKGEEMSRSLREGMEQINARTMERLMALNEDAELVRERWKRERIRTRKIFSDTKKEEERRKMIALMNEKKEEKNAKKKQTLTTTASKAQIRTVPSVISTLKDEDDEKAEGGDAAPESDLTEDKILELIGSEFNVLDEIDDSREGTSRSGNENGKDVLMVEPSKQTPIDQQVAFFSKQLSEEDEVIEKETEEQILRHFPSEDEVNVMYKQISDKLVEFRKRKPERGEGPVHSPQSFGSATNRSQKSHMDETDTFSSLSRRGPASPDGKAIDTNDLQHELEEIWTLLETPTDQKIDMLIRYANVRMNVVLKDAIGVWRVIAEVVIAREECLYHWLMIESSLSKINTTHLNQATIRKVRVRRRQLTKRLNVITRYCRSLLTKHLRVLDDVVTYEGEVYLDKIQMEQAEIDKREKTMRTYGINNPAVLAQLNRRRD